MRSPKPSKKENTLGEVTNNLTSWMEMRPNLADVAVADGGVGKFYRARNRRFEKRKEGGKKNKMNGGGKTSRKDRIGVIGSSEHIIGKESILALDQSVLYQ